MSREFCYSGESIAAEDAAVAESGVDKAPTGDGRKGTDGERFL